jgi:hypothetical protein
VLWLAVAPAAAVLGLFAAFGWWDNARALLAAADRYRAWFTARDLGGSLAGTLQLLPLLWLAAGRGLRSPPARLLLGWIVYYVGMLIAVRAPFWMRHFLPVLPAAIALSAVGIDAARGRTRTAALAVVAASAAANVAVLAHFVLDGDNLSLRLFSRLTLG